MPDPAADPSTAKTAAISGRPDTPWRAQPGDLLGGRYRLTAMVASGATDLWKAHDEVLARQVAVRLLSNVGATAAQRAAFVRAAAAAGQVVGPGIASVYDAATEPAAPRPGEDARQIGVPVSYVVAEWVDGRPLTTRLRQGTLPAAEACTLVSDLCGPVHAAHQQGVFAGRLHPGQVILNNTGAPRLTDLAVASVVHGQPDPAATASAADLASRDDTRGLARILYASLTGFWPDPGWDEPWTGLASAPLRDGRLCLPRQVKAGLPRDVDLVIARALDPRRRPDDPAISTPSNSAMHWPGSVPPATHDPSTAPRSPLSTEARPRRRRRWLVFPVVGLLVVLAVAGWLLGLVIGRVPGTTATAPKVPIARASASGAAAAAPLVPAMVTSFDPQGDKHENETDVPNATDNDPTSVWDTEQYNSATFGNLKTGVGLLVDLGTSQAISHVNVTAPAGERLELLAGNSTGTAPTSDSQTKVAAGPVTAVNGKETVLKPAAATTGRYFVVWITALPPSAASGAVAKNAYVGQIAEMSFFA